MVLLNGTPANHGRPVDDGLFIVADDSVDLLVVRSLRNVLSGFVDGLKRMCLRYKDSSNEEVETVRPAGR